MIILDENKNHSLYHQIYRQIKDKISSGQLLEEAKLPSCRQLAKDLNISRNTVESAYQQLCAEGYLVSKPRSGFYVAKLERDRLRIIPKSLENATKAEENEGLQYDFQYERINHTHCPFGLWRKLINQCLQTEQESIVASKDAHGKFGLRLQIMKYLAEFRGVSCFPEQIIIGAGIQHCLSVLCHLIKQDFQSIAIEDPGYNGTKAVIRNHGFNLIPISLDENGINIELLASSSTKVVYITPSYQFPTGKIMPIAKRLELIEWAAKENGLIIEEDYHSDFKWLGKAIPSLQGLNSKGSIIYLGTFSKAMALPISYMILPEPILQKYQKTFEEYNSLVPTLYQRTLELFMEMGYWERHLRKMGQIYRKKHHLLIQQITEQMGDQVFIHGKNGGLHIIAESKNGLSEEGMIERAKKAGIRVYPVSKHWLESQHYSNNMVLLGFSGLSEEEIVQGVSLLKKAWFTLETNI